MTHPKKTEYIIDEKGNRIKVILAYKDYIKMLHLLEEAEDSKKIKKTSQESQISLKDYKRKRELL